MVVRHVGHIDGHWRDYSMLDLVAIYNSLAKGIVEPASTVSEFQRALQLLQVDSTVSNVAYWEQVYSPRIPLHRYPLRNCSHFDSDDVV